MADTEGTNVWNVIDARIREFLLPRKQAIFSAQRFSLAQNAFSDGTMAGEISRKDVLWCQSTIARTNQVKPLNVSAFFFTAIIA